MTPLERLNEALETFCETTGCKLSKWETDSGMYIYLKFPEVKNES